jgi:hypothetical protein
MCAITYVADFTSPASPAPPTEQPASPAGQPASHTDQSYAFNISRATTTHPISARLAPLQKVLKKLPPLDVLPLLVLQQRKLMKSPRYQATKIQYECRVKGRMNAVLMLYKCKPI